MVERNKERVGLFDNVCINVKSTNVEVGTVKGGTTKTYLLKRVKPCYSFLLTVENGKTTHGSETVYGVLLFCLISKRMVRNLLI